MTIGRLQKSALLFKLQYNLSFQLFRMLMPLNIRAGHRKFKLNSAKLQEVFRNRKSASLR